MIEIGQWTNGKKFIVFDELENGERLTVCWTLTVDDWNTVKEFLGYLSHQQKANPNDMSVTKSASFRKSL